MGNDSNDDMGPWDWCSHSDEAKVAVHTIVRRKLVDMSIRPCDWCKGRARFLVYTRVGSRYLCESHQRDRNRKKTLRDVERWKREADQSKKRS